MSTTYTLFNVLLIAVNSLSSTLDDHILYFDEWRFDWDHVNDFDNDYHRDWEALITNPGHQNGYGCTHSLSTIGKKLCILERSDGDYLFKFKDTNTGSNVQHVHSPMVSAARELSDYYDDILLHFDEDSDWSSIESIDGVNGYEAIRKCEPFQFMELCAIYNPYSDNLNVHIKVAHSTTPRHGISLSRSQSASAHRISDNLYDDIHDEDIEMSIDDAISYLMDDYDDTLGYSYWRGNTLGFDEFDRNGIDHNGRRTYQWGKIEDHDNDALEEQYGAHSHYFNTMTFDWDDSRDWVSFSKQTEMAQVHSFGAKTEEVGAHPAKLEEVGAHPSKLEMKTIGGSSKVLSPSRSYTKCTGAIPLVHKHACVTMAGSDVRVHLAAATEDEINILYNGLDDMFQETADIDMEDMEDTEMNSETADNQYSARRVDIDSVLWIESILFSINLCCYLFLYVLHRAFAV